MTQRERRQGSHQPTLRIGSTIGVPDVLEALNFDPAEVLAEVGIELSLFDDPGNQISYHARGRMLAHCAVRTNCPHFGLLVGQKAGLSSLGVVGLLAKYSPNLNTALDSIVRCMHLHVRGARAALEVGSNVTVLEYQIYQLRAPGNH